jgi:hypothetical protein
MPPSGETEPLAAANLDEWYKKATVACAPFLYPESRFRTPWTGDELTEAVVAARKWHEQNPCPDELLDKNLTSILDAYSEMAFATVARVMELRESILSDAKAFERRKTPRARGQEWRAS